MTGEGTSDGGDDVEARAEGAAEPVRLRAVAGPIGSDAAPPSVHLVREYKGLTVADMFRDEIVERLPGQLRTALHHVRKGDYAAAEAAVPGEFGAVLPGPGARLCPSMRLLLWLCVTAALTAGSLASWWF